jgi:hypothetical protein
MSQVSDVISFLAGKVIGVGEDQELYTADAAMVPELDSARKGKAYGFEACRRACLQPDLFDWRHWEVGNPLLLASELKYKARYEIGWPFKTRKPSPESR